MGRFSNATLVFTSGILLIVSMFLMTYWFYMGAETCHTVENSEGKSELKCTSPPRNDNLLWVGMAFGSASILPVIIKICYVVSDYLNAE